MIRPQIDAPSDQAVLLGTPSPPQMPLSSSDPPSDRVNSGREGLPLRRAATDLSGIDLSSQEVLLLQAIRSVLASPTDDLRAAPSASDRNGEEEVGCVAACGLAAPQRPHQQVPLSSPVLSPHAASPAVAGIGG